MFDHIGLDVSDLKASVDFYRAALAPLGRELTSKHESVAGFGDDPVLYLVGGRSVTAHAHLAFRAGERSAVDAFHAAGIEHGGTDNGPPGIRDNYGPTYYAAFVLDPDGNNIEAVCTT